jgi:PBP1b-binding outer membrane lipoprotein LpoB
MKQFLAVLAIAGSLVACNNAADSAENTKDSIDSAASEVKDRMDSTTNMAQDRIDSNAEAKKDMVDSMQNKMDSTNK